jgi:Predicted nucleotide-binding protein containing TIR-like domain
MSNKGKIFVGSSSEAKDLVYDPIGQLIKEAGMELVPWDTSFPPSTYLLEVLEKSLPQQLTGAILLATPDVFEKRGDARFSTPVANVVLEYGYLSARLGRKRVIICEFDDVDLPSDLKGLTNVRAGKYVTGSQSSFLEDAKGKLRSWLAHLPPVADEIPPIRQLHGYSGEWKVQANFSLWRGKRVEPGAVVFNGFTVLCLDAEGKTGVGIQRGILTVNLGDYRPRLGICNHVETASIDEKGKLTLTVKVLYREPLARTKGEPPVLGEDWLKKPEQAPSFEVHLSPDLDKPKFLQGYHEFTPSAGLHQYATETWEYLDL